MRQLAIVFMSLLFAGSVGAEPSARPRPANRNPNALDRFLYERAPRWECRVARIGETVSEERTWLVEGPLDEDSGGAESTLTLGPSQLTLQATRTWMSLLWEENGVTVAQVLNRLDPLGNDHRNLVVFHPQKDSEQVQFSCERLYLKSPDLPDVQDDVPELDGEEPEVGESFG